jgi:hypothetical protein
VIKKTGKFTPLDQWVHHEDHALVTDEAASNVGPAFGSRYDDQIRVLGKDFQKRAAGPPPSQPAPLTMRASLWAVRVVMSAGHNGRPAHLPGRLRRAGLRVPEGAQPHGRRHLGARQDRGDGHGIFSRSPRAPGELKSSNIPV